MMRRLLAAFAALLLLSLPAVAQQRVDCQNGFWCPADHACLKDGLCGRLIAAPPGAVRMSNGNFCDPGFSESVNRPGRCIPPGAQECSDGTSCPRGTSCAASGGCEGAVGSGPVCGGTPCLPGRVCTAHGTCMNPELHHDCGNGTICTHAAVCEMPTGCAYVAPQRTRQQR